MTQDKQFVDKKYVTMFFTNPECPLSYTDRATYCYRTFQASYGEIPSHRRTAKATGLKEETVAKATERLRGHGLLDTDNTVISPCPRADWFQELETLRERFREGHFSKWLRNWRCYVRTPGADNPLQVTDVTIYSLIRNSVFNQWKPQHGWSHEYLALATGTSAETVAKALTKLEELGFLAVDEGMVFRLYRLRDAQLRCFADKTTFSGTASADPDKLLDEFSPASEIFEKQQAERDRFVEWLNRWAIPNKAKDGIYKTVVRDPEWPERWQEKAESLVGRAMDFPYA